MISDRRLGQERSGRKNVGRRVTDERLSESFAVLQLLQQRGPASLRRPPIWQPRVMTGNHIGEQPAVGAEAVRGVNGAGDGMLHPAWRCLDVRFHAAGRADVSLEFGLVFAEVVPQTGKMCPVD